MNNINKKYDIIYADPPWYYTQGVYQDNGRKKRLLTEQYPTMLTKDICNLNVSKITKNDCVCFMWVTDSHLMDGLEVLHAWGFTYKTIGFTWVKQTNKNNICYNFSPYLLKSTEICIIGIKGKLSNIKVTNNVKGLVFAERTKHSKKPNIFRDLITEWCGNKQKIELFARETAPGWDCWGNEVPQIPQDNSPMGPCA